MPDANIVGSGQSVILSDGEMADATWSQADRIGHHHVPSLGWLKCRPPYGRCHLGHAGARRGPDGVELTLYDAADWRMSSFHVMRSIGREAPIERGRKRPSEQETLGQVTPECLEPLHLRPTLDTLGDDGQASSESPKSR